MNTQRVITLIEFENVIVCPKTLAAAVSKIGEHFSEINYQQPPLPENISSLIPFNLHITETEGLNREIIGRVRLLKEDGTVCYDVTWKPKK